MSAPAWYAALSDVAPTPARAATRPREFEVPLGEYFGTGLGNQPHHETLLREIRGIADVATRAIANRVSGLEWEVRTRRRRTAGTVVEEILDDHPLKALLDRPHSHFTKRQQLRLAVQHVLTVGEAYWLKVGNRLGVPMELHPIPPARIEPIVSLGTVTGYRVQLGSGEVETLPADVVVRAFWPDPEHPWQAEGYLGPMGAEADGRKFMIEHTRAHFQHDASPKTVIETSDLAQLSSKDAQEAFEADWENRYHARLGRHRGGPAILPAGFKLISMAIQSGAEVTPLLEHFRDDLLMGFGTPRSILGQVVSGDRSSAETNAFVFDMHTVTPVADLLSDSVTLHLASDFDEGIVVRFEEFVAPDKEFELKREDSDIVHKRSSPNLQLVARGHDPVPWGERPVAKMGETYYEPDIEPAPLPLDDAEALGNEELGQPEDDERSYFGKRATWARRVAAEKTYVPAFSRAVRKVLRDQRDSVLARLEAQGGRSAARAPEDVVPASLFTPEEWARLFWVNVEPIRRLALEAAGVEALAGLGSQSFVFTEAVRRLLDEQGATMIRAINRTTRERIVATLNEAIVEGESVGQMATRIRHVFAVRRKQAQTIARTEVLRATQAGQLEGFDQSGVVRFKRWNTSLDASVRDTHSPVDGQQVELRDVFTLGDGERASAPGIGEGGGPLSAHNAINCRCFVTPVVEE